MPLCPSPAFLLPDRNYIVVANAAARPTGAALITGMTIYQVDVQAQYLWDGSSWIALATRNPIIVANAAARPTGTARVTGMLMYQLDVQTLYLWDGTGWVVMAEPVQTWTSVLTTMNLGNGTLVGRYQRSNGRCRVTWKFTLGSTSTVGTSPTFTIPIAPADGLRDISAVPVDLSDAGTARYGGLAVWASGVIVNVLPWSAAGAVLQQGTITATVPMTWATGDYMSTNFDYEMTTRYS